MANSNSKTRTRDVLFRMLTEMDCQYELTEDGNVFIKYKDVDINDDGEDIIEEKVFYAVINDDEDADEIILYYPHQTHINSKDETEFSRLRKVINGSNTYIDISTVYGVDDTTDDVFVYSWRVFDNISQMLDFKTRLIMAMLGCLDAAFFVEDSMQKSR